MSKNFFPSEVATPGFCMIAMSTDFMMEDFTGLFFGRISNSENASHSVLIALFGVDAANFFTHTSFIPRATSTFTCEYGSSSSECSNNSIIKSTRL